MLVSHVIFVHTLLDRPSHLLENAAVSSENDTLKVGARLRRARLSEGLRTRDLAQAVGCDKMVHALDRDMASFFGLKIDEYKLVQKPNGFKTTLSIDLSEATVKTIGV